MFFSLDVEVRIVDGPTVREGRVEIHRLGVWGAICDDNFTDEDATVVCRESGYDVGVAHVASTYGTADGTIEMLHVYLNTHKRTGNVSASVRTDL